MLIAERRLLHLSTALSVRNSLFSLHTEPPIGGRVKVFMEAAPGLIGECRLGRPVGMAVLLKLRVAAEAVVAIVIDVPWWWSRLATIIKKHKH